MDIFVLATLWRPTPSTNKGKGAQHANVASLEKTNKNKNVEYLLLEHLVIIQHGVTGAGAAGDVQQQQRPTQDHGSPP